MDVYMVSFDAFFGDDFIYMLWRVSTQSENEDGAFKLIYASTEFEQVMDRLGGIQDVKNG